MSTSLISTSYDGTGEIVGEVRKLTDMDQIAGTSVNNLNATLNHISSQMAFVVQINKVDTQSQVLSERKITVDEKISEIGDVDLTELVTQLKSLILNRDAAQQACKNWTTEPFDYSKIVEIVEWVSLARDLQCLSKTRPRKDYDENRHEHCRL